MSVFVVQPPVMETGDGVSRIRCGYAPDRELVLTVEAPSSVLNRIEPDIACFLPVIILIAANEGATILVEEAVESGYWLNLASVFAPLAKSLFGCAPVGIQRAATLNAAPRAPKGRTGLMFSAGVDSFYSLLTMERLGLAPDLLININAGAHDEDEACWRSRYRNAGIVAEERGLPLALINTNFHIALPELHRKVHVVRNLAAAFALRGAVRHFIYSSSFPFEGISFDYAAEHDISAIEHAVAAAMTPPDAMLSVLGGDATRAHKTATIASDALVRRTLDVCTEQSYQSAIPPGGPRNCSRCNKCVLTMFTLEAAGALDAFATQFDVGAFGRNRAVMLAALKQEPGALSREAAALASNEVQPR